MLELLPNRTEATGDRNQEINELCPYSAIFCMQVLAAQDFAHTPPLSRTGNSVKTRILDIWYQKMWDMTHGPKQRGQTPSGACPEF
jgi:hypothetical protein